MKLNVGDEKKNGRKKKTSNGKNERKIDISEIKQGEKKRKKSLYNKASNQKKKE